MLHIAGQNTRLLTSHAHGHRAGFVGAAAVAVASLFTDAVGMLAVVEAPVLTVEAVALAAPVEVAVVVAAGADFRFSPRAASPFPFPFPSPSPSMYFSTRPWTNPKNNIAWTRNLNTQKREENRGRPRPRIKTTQCHGNSLLHTPSTQHQASTAV